MMAELFSFRRCPYAMRARMALYCSGVPFQITEVSLKQKPERMLTLSPKGTVPVLVTVQGDVIDQSLDIMHWALRQSDPEGWLARSQQAEPARLLQLNDGAFKGLLDRYKYPNRYPQETVVSEAARDAAMTLLLAPLADVLSQQAFIGGAAPALEDVAIFPFIRQFAGVQPTWFAQHAPTVVQSWLAYWLNSALFETVMRKPS